MKKLYKQTWFWLMIIAVIMSIGLIIYISQKFVLDDKIWTCIESLATLISVIIAVYSIVSSENIRKKQATYDAYNEFKKSNYKNELEFGKYAIEDVLSEHKNNENKKWDIIKEYLTEIERISTCVNNGVFECGTIYNMGGPYLIEQYEKLKPILIEKRNSSGRIVYGEFENMVIKLKEIDKSRRN